jgi:hypothetical protein
MPMWAIPSLAQRSGYLFSSAMIGGLDDSGVDPLRVQMPSRTPVAVVSIGLRRSQGRISMS